MRNGLGTWALLASALALSLPAAAADYHVGPGQPLSSIGAVPWATLAPGDHVYIHWRDTPYAEKWVLCRRGSVEQPIVVSGVPGPGNALPIIDGSEAVTAPGLNFTNDARGVLKIGSANVPADLLPGHLVVENLEIRNARPGIYFSDDGGSRTQYAQNAAALYIEKAEQLTIRNCRLHGAGNGLFIGVYDGQTQEILVEGNHIHDNGNVGSIYEHNSYTAARGITFQYNRYGPLCSGCGGNNLKDRSAGLVVRYNWIESGNRQLDLVDGEDSINVVNDPRYRTTFVYGNVLIEPDGAGNSQIAHYGGDSGTEADYRKGTLHFYNNTVISTRSGNTTLLRLSTNDEHADLRNNIVYAAAGSGYLALLAASGVADLSHNWLQQGWVDSHDGSFAGTISDDGTGLTGSAPGFENAGAQDFDLASGSPCINAGTALAAAAIPANDVVSEYVPHRQSMARPVVATIDMGAFEYCAAGSCGPPDAGSVDGARPDSARPDSARPDSARPDSALVHDAAGADLITVDAGLAADRVATDAASDDRGGQPDRQMDDRTSASDRAHPTDRASADGATTADGATGDHPPVTDGTLLERPTLDSAPGDNRQSDQGGSAADAANDGAPLAADRAAGHDVVASGCACNTARGDRAPGALAVLMLLAALWRRRLPH